MRLNIELPDELQREVKAAAVLLGMTLRDYVVAILRKEVGRRDRRLDDVHLDN